jgi:PAS domain S-box-containing protein
MAAGLLLITQILSLKSGFFLSPQRLRLAGWNPLQEQQISALRIFGLGLLATSIYYTLQRAYEVKARLIRSREDLVRESQERTRSEEALRTMEHRYHELLDNANDIIYTIDLSGNFTSFNKTGEELTGYTSQEILKMNVSGLVVPEQLSMVREMIKQRIAGAAPDKYDVQIQSKNGRRLQLEISTRLMVEHGVPAGIHGIARNTTEKKEAQRALENTTRLYQRAIQVAGAVPYYFNYLTNEFEFVGDEIQPLTGYSPGEFNREIWETMTKDIVLLGDLEGLPLPEAIQKARSKEGVSWRADYRIRARDGADKWVANAAVQDRDEKGRLTGSLGILQDITERKRGEEERAKLDARIQQTQKIESLGLLAGGIAHDFNNLLVGVLGHVSMAFKDTDPTSPVRERLHHVETAAIRAAELANQMLAYSGRGRFVSEPISLSELVQEMGHLLEVSISKCAVLKYQFAPDLPAVEGDVTQLRQVVMNLITNASEAIGDRSGVITIGTGVTELESSQMTRSYVYEELPRGIYACIEVCDTGCGMDKETIARIFDPFYSTKFTGRGLGLSAVLGIIRGHKGAIRVYSEPGRGTTFKILFPCSRKAAISLSKPESNAAHARLEGTVLVVDDEETVRTIAKSMLEEYGLHVLTACDGREAVDVYRSKMGAISLVLLDMTMPHMGGEEAFDRIREMDPEALVILTSGYNEQEATGRFAGKGLTAFLQKPYRLSNLIDTVWEVLNGERAKTA